MSKVATEMNSLWEKNIRSPINLLRISLKKKFLNQNLPKSIVFKKILNLRKRSQMKSIVKL